MEKQETETDAERTSKTENDLYQFIFTNDVHLALSLVS